jgi:uncharacterized protein
VIFVDSNVPMYLVGGDHALKRRVVELVPRLVTVREQLVTSAEVFQEIIHRFLAIRDRAQLNAAYEALETMVSMTFDVTKSDVDQARAMAAEYDGLSSRDCLHVAVMRRAGSVKVWSYDEGFDVVPSIQRVQ